MTEVERILERALRYGEEGEWKTMAEVLADGLISFENDAYLLCWLAVAERELGNEGESYERFKQAVAQQPEDPRLLAMAGMGLARVDDPEAEGVLRAAALLGPDLVETRLAYGGYLAREGLQSEALEELEAARALDPDDVAVVTELGVALALQGDHEEATDVLDRAVRLSHDDPWPRTLLGLVLLESDRLEEAAGELSEAARAAPQDVEAQVLAALTSAATGRDELALEMIERGRQSASATERSLIEEADDRILDGARPSRELLMDAVAPRALHRRLMARP